MTEHVALTLPDPRPLAVAQRQVRAQLARRYRKASRRRTRIARQELVQMGIAAAWEAIGEQAETAAALQQAQRLAQQYAQLDEELQRLTRVLTHLGVDPLSLAEFP